MKLLVLTVSIAGFVTVSSALPALADCSQALQKQTAIDDNAAEIGTSAGTGLGLAVAASGSLELTPVGGAAVGAAAGISTTAGGASTAVYDTLKDPTRITSALLNEAKVGSGIHLQWAANENSTTVPAVIQALSAAFQDESLCPDGKLLSGQATQTLLASRLKK